MSFYWKAIAMVVATVVSAVIAALTGDGIVSNPEWVNIAILGVGAASVFTAPNIPGFKYTKVVLAVLFGTLTVLASAIIGGITTTEWLQILMAGLAAVGVYAAPKSGQY